MEKIEGIPIGDLLKASYDPVEAAKLAVVRASSQENKAVNFFADQVVHRLHQMFKELEVANIVLPNYALGSKDISNDPDADNFSPEDQFPAVLDTVKQCFCLLVVTSNSLTLPHSNTVRFLERLLQVGTKYADEHQTRKMFAKHCAGAIVTGDEGAWGCASTVLSTLNSLGYAVPNGGAIICGPTDYRKINTDKMYLVDEMARSVKAHYDAFRR